MRVKAIKTGFHKGRRVHEGKEFDVPEGTTGKWFIPVKAAPAEQPEAADEAAPAKGRSKAKNKPAPGDGNDADLI